MPKLGRTKPCAECPFLRKSAPGYLGADNPIHFERSVIASEAGMPCHMAIDYDDEDWLTSQLPDSDLCAGSLMHLNGQMKRPKTPELAAACDAVGTSPHVFTWPEEFMAHHMRGRSAEEVRLAVQYASWPFASEGEEKLIGRTR